MGKADLPEQGETLVKLGDSEQENTWKMKTWKTSENPARLDPSRSKFPSRNYDLCVTCNLYDYYELIHTKLS